MEKTVRNIKRAQPKDDYGTAKKQSIATDGNKLTVKKKMLNEGFNVIEGAHRYYTRPVVPANLLHLRAHDKTLANLKQQAYRPDVKHVEDEGFAESEHCEHFDTKEKMKALTDKKSATVALSSAGVFADFGPPDKPASGERLTPYLDEHIKTEIIRIKNDDLKKNFAEFRTLLETNTEQTKEKVDKLKRAGSKQDAAPRSSSEGESRRHAPKVCNTLKPLTTNLPSKTAFKSNTKLKQRSDDELLAVDKHGKKELGKGRLRSSNHCASLYFQAVLQSAKFVAPSNGKPGALNVDKDTDTSEDVNTQ